MEKEEKFLEGITLGKLTHLEFDQCINRQVTELEAQGAEVLTDASMNQMLTELKSISQEFHQSILKVQKSLYTDELATLDELRDRALQRYNNALKNFKYSDNPDELKAFRKLSILWSSYKEIKDLNYEAESDKITKFLNELESDQFSAEVALLDLGSYINRIKTTQADFYQLFNSRSNEAATKVVLDASKIRRTLMTVYNHFAKYIEALATMLDKEPYNASLKIMNVTRSYYDDIIKRREGMKNNDESEKPGTPN